MTKVEVARPPRCKVCRSAQIVAIDEALVRGDPTRLLAVRFAIPRSTLRDHERKGHIPKTLAKAANAQAVADGDALLGKVLEIEAQVRRLAAKAEREGDVRGAIGGMRELTRIAELLGRLSGELRSRTQVNLILTPEWMDLSRRILAALRPFPEARLAVAEALDGVRALPPAPEGME